jgi:cellulose synthase/poly-beta-1,6-N-acetylglucosamine synthase-like glycosyltransferase
VTLSDILDTGVYAILATALVLLCILSCNLLWLAWVYWRHQSNGQKMEAAPASEIGDGGLPHVLIQIPVFNEKNVVRRILSAAAALDWPADRLSIQLLDDSTDETREIGRQAVDELRRGGSDATWLHRVDRTGFKAGALQNGLDRSEADFVAIFDADFIPRPDFLRRTIGILVNDPALAFVQARWDHLNSDENRLTRAQTLMLDAHFGIEQPARSMTGLPLPFNGTCGVWRRAAILDAGGWTADTLTEDLDLSLRAHLRGWRARFLADVAVPGELPAGVVSWRVQQFRWTKGFAQVAWKLLPTIWRSGMPVKAKTAVTLQLLQCLFYPLAVLAMCNTILFLTVGLDQPVLLSILGITSTVIGMVGTSAFLLSGRLAIRRHRLAEGPIDLLITLALNAGLALSNSGGVIEAVMGRRSGFVRTPKKGSARSSGYRTMTANGVPELLASGVLFTMLLLEIAWYLPFLAVSASGLLIVGYGLFAERYDVRLPRLTLPHEAALPKAGAIASPSSQRGLP